MPAASFSSLSTNYQRMEWRLRDRITDRLVLVALVALDLALRSGDEFVALVASGSSIAIGVDLLDVSSWTVFFALVVVAVPRLFPRLLSPLTSSIAFRGWVAAACVVLGALFTQIQSVRVAVATVVVLVGYAIGLFVLFDRYDRSVFDPDDLLVAGLDWLAPGDELFTAELQRSLERTGPLRTVSLALIAFAAAAFFSYPVVVGGLLLSVLQQTFPVPDFLVLVYLAVTAVSKRTDRLQRPPELLSVDTYLLSFVKRSTDTITGPLLVLLVGLGTLLTLLPPLLSLRILRSTGRVELFLTAGPMTTWNFVGTLALLLTSFCYGLWFWLRLLPRLTVFLELWRGAENRTPRVARPRSLTAPSSLTFLAALAGIATGLTGSGRLWFAAVWPALVLGVIVLCYRTYDRAPPSAGREDLVLAAAVAIPAATLFTFPEMETTAPGRLRPVTIYVVALLWYVVGVARVIRYSNRYDRRYAEHFGDPDRDSQEPDGGVPDDERRYAFALYLAIGGLYSLLASGYLSSDVRILTSLLGLALVVFGAASFVVRYYRL